MPRPKHIARRTTADVAKMVEDDLTAINLIDCPECDTCGPIIPVTSLDLSPGQLRFREDQKLIPPLPASGPLCPTCNKPCTPAEYAAYGRHEDCAAENWARGTGAPKII